LKKAAKKPAIATVSAGTIQVAPARIGMVTFMGMAAMDIIFAAKHLLKKRGKRKLKIKLCKTDGSIFFAELSRDIPESHYGIPVIVFDGSAYGQLDLVLNDLLPLAETEEESAELKAGDIQHLRTFDGFYYESRALRGHVVARNLNFKGVL